MKKMGWLLGWAVPETWFAAQVRGVFPEAEHVFVEAAPNALERLEATGPFDVVVGYSLGSLLLLREAERAQRLVRGGTVSLLAPIFAYPREADAGGRVARAQVRLAARRLRSDPTAALADFYRLAGLGVAADSAFSEEKLAVLAWGLERLEKDGVAAKLPEGWRAWCGAEDVLLDAAWMKALVPELTVVPGAGHHPAGLLRAMGEGVGRVIPHAPFGLGLSGDTEPERRVKDNPPYLSNPPSAHKKETT